MKNKSLLPRHRLASFRYAYQGLLRLVAQEPNAKLHLLATVAAVSIGCARHLSPTRWALLLLVIGFVWVAEALNTCIELLCDLWCKGTYHPTVKTVKDIAAAAVLIAAGVALLAGVLLLFS